MSCEPSKYSERLDTARAEFGQLEDILHTLPNYILIDIVSDLVTELGEHGEALAYDRLVIDTTECSEFPILQGVRQVPSGRFYWWHEGKNADGSFKTQSGYQLLLEQAQTMLARAIAANSNPE